MTYIVSQNQSCVNSSKKTCPAVDAGGSACKRRTCIAPSCRETWAYNEQSKLYHANLRVPVTKVMRFSLFRNKDQEENVFLMRQVLREVNKYASNHDLTFDYRLYPEQTRRGSLHFHGVARMDGQVEKVLRRSWVQRRGEGRGTYSVKEIKDWGQVTYCVKLNRQAEFDPVTPTTRRQQLVLWGGNLRRVKATVLAKLPKTYKNETFSDDRRSNPFWSKSLATSPDLPRPDGIGHIYRESEPCYSKCPTTCGECGTPDAGKASRRDMGRWP